MVFHIRGNNKSIIFHWGIFHWDVAQLLLLHAIPSMRCHQRQVKCWRMLSTKILMIWANEWFKNIHIEFDKSFVLFLLSICYMRNWIWFVAHGQCRDLLDSCTGVWVSLLPSVDLSMASGPVQWFSPYIEIKQIIMKNLSRKIINCDKEQANSFSTSGEYVESEIVLALFWTFGESAGCSINILKY